MSNKMEEFVVNSADYHFNLQSEVFAQLEMQARRRLYSKRPDIWAKDILGVTLWSKQREIAISLVENHNTMVAACHAAGKSFLTAVLICWWIDTKPIGKARVLSTAPSNAQVKGIVWREVQLLHAESKRRHAQYLHAVENGLPTQGLPDHALPGYVTTQATWRTDDGVELGIGRTPPRGREGDSFQGIHAGGEDDDPLESGGVLAIIDEAVGVNSELINTMRNNTTNDIDRVLMIANPTNPGSEMGQIWNTPKRASEWNRIRISLFDTPRFMDHPKFTGEREELPTKVVKALVGEKYLNGVVNDFGEDSAYYRARILGEWAVDADMILFPEEILGLSRDVVVVAHEGDKKYVGFDVSRSPRGDYSYLYLVEEGWVYETQKWDTKSGDWKDLKKPKKTDKRGIRVRFLDKWRGVAFQPIVDARGARMGGEHRDGLAANEIVHAHMISTGATELRIDIGGMGTLMYDAMLNVYGEAYELVEIDGGSTPPTGNRAGHYNLRAYGMSELARQMREGTVDLDPEDATLLEQLAGIEYKFAAGYADAMLIQSKEDMRKKGVKSPDAADAVWMGAVLVDTGSDSIGEDFEYDYDPIVSEFDHFYASQPW